MQPIPYLFFGGTCAEALTAYGKLVGTSPELFRFKDMPEDAKAHMPGTPPDAVMHGALKVGEGWIYASDDPTGETSAMAGCNVHLSFPTVEEAHRVFKALADGGETRMPIAPAFWAPAFGTCTDRFGVRWMISADAPAGGN